MMTDIGHMDPRRPGVAEVVWELGHALWHAVREDPSRHEQYNTMRTPMLGDFVIELTHRYGADAEVNPDMVGWMVGGDSFHPIIAPLGTDYRRVRVDNGVVIALPIRNDAVCQATYGQNDTNHPDTESPA